MTSNKDFYNFIYGDKDANQRVEIWLRDFEVKWIGKIKNINPFPEK